LKIETRTATGAAATKIASGTETLEAAKFRLALGVDLAAIVSLALIFLAEDLVGRIDLGKALSGLGIILVGVGVQFLCELAKGTLDRGCVRILFYPQHFIGVAHCKFLRSSAGAQPRLSGSNGGLMRQIRNAKRSTCSAPRAKYRAASSSVEVGRHQLVGHDRDRARRATRTKQLAGRIGALHQQQ